MGGQYGVMQNEWFDNEEENDKIEIEIEEMTIWQNDDMTMELLTFTRLRWASFLFSWYYIW